MSRSASEPDFGLVTQKLKVASLPKVRKPVTGGEVMSKHSPGLPGWLGTARRDRSVEDPGRPGRMGK